MEYYKYKPKRTAFGYPGKISAVVSIDAEGAEIVEIFPNYRDEDAERRAEKMSVDASRQGQDTVSFLAIHGLVWSSRQPTGDGYHEEIEFQRH